MKTKYQNLSTSELQTLETLEAEAEILDQHKKSCRLPEVSGAVKAARDAYVASPSDAALEKYSAALHREAWIVFPPHTNGANLAVTVETARTAFVETKLRPFIAPIIERVLDRARKNFEAVKKNESKKIEDATGHPYHEGIKSKPIDEARGVVSELESLSGAIAAAPKFFAAFREAFGAA